MADNKNLLSCFWSLADLDETSRAESVIGIIKELKSSSTQEETLAYVLKRLVKGLASSRKRARQGFSTALVHVLNEFAKSIEVDNVLELMNTNLKHSKSVPGNEERDAYFGKTFGFLAILQHLQMQINSDKVLFIQKLYKELITFMKKKKYLREVCAVAICKSLTKIENSIFKENLEDIVFENLTFGWESGTAEDVLITCEIISQYNEDKELRNRFKEVWGSKDVLKSSNLEKLSTILMNTTEVSHPKVHSLWKYVLEKALEDEEYMKTFWTTIVEGGLLQSTHERKFLALQLLLQLTPNISTNMVTTVFSSPMMKCLINSCNSKENFLFKAAKDILSKLPERLGANEDKDVIGLVIQTLVGSYGNIAFDTITNTKTVDSLTTQLTQVEEHFTWLREVFVNPTTRVNGKDATSIQVWVLNQMTTLAKTAKKLDKEDLLLQIACFLFLHSYFDVIKGNTKEPLLSDTFTDQWDLTDKVHDLAKQRFQTTLTELTCWRRNKSTEKFKVGVDRDGVLFTEKILLFAKRLVGKGKYVVLRETWVPETYEAFNEEMDLLQEKAKVNSIATNKGMLLLRQHATLHLFKNHEEALGVLKDVQECCRKVVKKTKSKAEPHWCDVLMEILMGFLSQPSNVMRHVSENVFRIISSHLTDSSIQSMIKVISLKRAEDLNGDDDEEDDDEDMDKEESEESGEDEIENGVNGDKEADEESDESDSEDNEDDEDGDVDEIFKSNIKKALDKANLSMNGDESEESDQDLDMDSGDTKMLDALDETLAGIFKRQKEKQQAKKDKKSAERDMQHFKLRVLDLIVIFIKEQPKDDRIIGFVKPLLDMVYSTHGRSDMSAMHDKAVNVFKSKLCQHRNHQFTVPATDIHEIMKYIIESAKKSGANAVYVDLVSQGLAFLIKVLRGGVDMKGPSPLKTRSQRKRKVEDAEEEKPSAIKMNSIDEKEVLQLYIDGLTHFMTKRTSNLQPKLFLDLINRFPNLGWKLGLELPKYLNIGCNNFRKLKCSEMIKAVLSHKISVEDDEFFREVADAIVQNIVQVLESAGGDDFTLKPRQLSDIIRLTEGLKKLHHDHPIVTIDWSKLMESFESLLKKPIAGRCTSLSQQLQTKVKLCKSLST